MSNMNRVAIAEAHCLSFTLDIASQIAGIPPRLISTLVAASEHDGVSYYSLLQIERIFSDGTGARLLRKLRQNQLQIYRDCTVTWRDRNGTLRVDSGAFVELRGRRTEVTLQSGYRFTRPQSDPDLRFDGTLIQSFGEPA